MLGQSLAESLKTLFILVVILRTSGINKVFTTVNIHHMSDHFTDKILIVITDVVEALNIKTDTYNRYGNALELIYYIFNNIGIVCVCAVENKTVKR